MAGHNAGQTLRDPGHRGPAGHKRELLHRRQVSQDGQNIVQERPWSEAFQDSAIDFVDQLIDENKALVEELARL